MSTTRAAWSNTFLMISIGSCVGHCLQAPDPHWRATPAQVLMAAKRHISASVAPTSWDRYCFCCQHLRSCLKCPHVVYGLAIWHQTRIQGQCQCPQNTPLPRQPHLACFVPNMQSISPGRSGWGVARGGSSDDKSKQMEARRRMIEYGQR